MSRETYVQINGKFICKARDGVITDEYSRACGNKKSNPFSGYGSDTLGSDVNGVFNHADGLRYDSKSEYHRAVKAKGCRVVGNDFNDKQYKRPEVRGDFNIKPQFKEAVQRAIQQGKL